MPRISTRFRALAPFMLLPGLRPHAAAAAAPATPIATPAHPNFVVIMLDDLDTRTAAAMPGLASL
ncbi:MAG: hypothetical protein ACR2J8_13580, partial [Thermomicrobiales bacterium]